MDESNYYNYYLARAETSRSLARRAADPSMAAIHAELATRYDGMVATLARTVDVGGRGVQA